MKERETILAKIEQNQTDSQRAYRNGKRSPEKAEIVIRKNPR